MSKRTEEIEGNSARFRVGKVEGPFTRKHTYIDGSRHADAGKKFPPTWVVRSGDMETGIMRDNDFPSEKLAKIYWNGLLPYPQETDMFGLPRK